MEHILKGLNEKQIEAVQATEGPVLVISGPGSGKTRCLTHRIAWLIAQGTSAQHILAVTFTNKAAGEIKHRVTDLLNIEHAKSKIIPAAPTVGTFHSLGLRILRRDIGALGYRPTFTILDSSDQQALIKRILLSLELDSKRYPPNAMLSKIQALKTDLMMPDDYHPVSWNDKILARIYLAYQSELARMNAVDFGDLILLPVRILQHHPDVLERYQHLWKYILVDEYQDTSHDQYMLMRLLSGAHRNIFCIGDDAQSIYRFRQADIRNILHFQKDYPDGRVILLEQNYRSTKVILAAAQSVISNNRAQIPKDLWTDNGEGESIVVAECMNERHEAQWLVQTVRDLQRKRYTLSDCAVLYRTHAQSRALEEQLVRAGMPYRIVGGIRFYERREIKDLVAYLRFLHNPADAISFARIANTPTRGIGETTIERILMHASASDPFSAIETVASDHQPTSRTATSLRNVHALLTTLSAVAAEQPPSAILKQILRLTHYEEWLAKQKEKDTETIEDRLENIRELLTVAGGYDAAGPAGLPQFLEDVALLQDADRARDDERAITLMTIHAAKGLEFPIVFICGMEEGLFPHSRTAYDPHELEEERRLCYVAITRAKERLFISLATWRSIFGSRQTNIPSRFLGEMPQSILTWQKLDMDTEEGMRRYSYDD